MKKVVFLLLILALVLLPFAKADVVAFDFNKNVITDVVAKEISIPAKFNLTIFNRNIEDSYFTIYSLVDMKITPITPISIKAGESKTLIMGVQPLRWLNERGLHSVIYYIKSNNGGFITDTIMVKVLPLSEILFAETPETMARDDAKITVKVVNKENIDLGEATVTVSSDFFSTTTRMNITPKSTQSIELPLDQAQLKTGKAGSYPIKVIFFLNNNYNFTVEHPITLKEYSNVITTESSKFNFFGFTKIITKKNDGNTAKLITIETVKSRFEQAFTSSNIEPTYEKPSLTLVTMGWQKEVQPGENFTVEITTDYTIPVIILILLIIAAVSIYLLKRPRVILRKKAMRVHTKGGEFAIKIVVFVKNIGKEIHEVSLVDRFPHVSKLYERFGSMRPDKIETNKLEWNFGILAPGEERVVSYIIYSKVMPVGTIELPQSVIHYVDDKEKRKATFSNKVLVVGEPSNPIRQSS